MIVQERVSTKEIAEVAADVLAPQIQELTVHVFAPTPQVRVPECVVEQIIDVTVPHVMKEKVEAMRLIPKGAHSTTHCGEDRGNLSTSDPGTCC